MRLVRLDSSLHFSQTLSRSTSGLWVPMKLSPICQDKLSAGFEQLGTRSIQAMMFSDSSWAQVPRMIKSRWVINRPIFSEASLHCLVVRENNKLSLLRKRRGAALDTLVLQMQGYKGSHASTQLPWIRAFFRSSPAPVLMSMKIVTKKFKSAKFVFVVHQACVCAWSKCSSKNCLM